LPGFARLGQQPPPEHSKIPKCFFFPVSRVILAMAAAMRIFSRKIYIRCSSPLGYVLSHPASATGIQPLGKYLLT